MERRLAALVLSIDICLFLQQHLHSRYIVRKICGTLRGLHQRGESVLSRVVYLGAFRDEVPGVIHPAFFNGFDERRIGLHRRGSGCRSRTRCRATLGAR